MLVVMAPLDNSSSIENSTQKQMDYDDFVRKRKKKKTFQNRLFEVAQTTTTLVPRVTVRETREKTSPAARSGRVRDVRPEPGLTADGSPLQRSVRGRGHHRRFPSSFSRSLPCRLQSNDLLLSLHVDRPRRLESLHRHPHRLSHQGLFTLCLLLPCFRRSQWMQCRRRMSAEARRGDSP